MGDSPAGPRLAIVGAAASNGEEERGARPDAPESGKAAPGSRRLGRTRSLLWLAALVWLGVLLVCEFRHAGRLEARVQELSAQLGQAREALGIYQRRLGRVRSGLDELASRVEALQEIATGGTLPDSGPVPQAGGESALHASEGPVDPTRPSVHPTP